MACAEVDDAGFGPEACLAGLLGNEGAVATVFRGVECDMPVLLYAAGENCLVRDEGVVLCGDQKIGHADLVHNTLSTCGFVVFLSVAITEVRRGNRVVESADRADQTEPITRIFLREEVCLLDVASHQPSNEMALVEIVVAAFERIGASREVE